MATLVGKHYIDILNNIIIDNIICLQTQQIQFVYVQE